jgi:ArsR family transcriptional regulator
MDIDSCQHRRMSNSSAAPKGRRQLPLTPLQTVACCSPLMIEPLSVEAADQVASLLKALADPVRLRLMSLVASHAGGEACVCDLTGAFDLSQPTISHHLKVLHELGLLDREKRGVWVYYRLNAGALRNLGTLIGTIPAAEPAEAVPA